MDAECARWQAEVDNLRGELARAEATYNDTNARAQYAHAVMQERNAQEEGTNLGGIEGKLKKNLEK